MRASSEPVGQGTKWYRAKSERIGCSVSFWAAEDELVGGERAEAAGGSYGRGKMGRVSHSNTSKSIKLRTVQQRRYLERQTLPIGDEMSSIACVASSWLWPGTFFHQSEATDWASVALGSHSCILGERCSVSECVVGCMIGRKDAGGAYL
jgi:hypothetical protein